MGGLAGHLNHIHDDDSLTFFELKDIITRGLDGTLGSESLVVEKIDGYNLYVTVKDGEVKLARNKSTLKSPVGLSEIEEKYKNSNSAFEISGNLIKELQSTFNELQQSTLDSIFKNGLRFLSTEVYQNDPQNIVEYGKDPFILFHALVEYDQDGNLIKYSTKAAALFYEMLLQAQLTSLGKFSILPQVVKTFQKCPNHFEYQKYFLTLLNRLQREFNLSDSDTIASYYTAWWFNYINQEFPLLDQVLKNHLINRWALGKRNFRIYSKYFKEPSTFTKVKEIDSETQKILQKQNYEKFENLFLELGAVILFHQNEYFSDIDPQEYRKNLITRIKTLKDYVKDPLQQERVIILLHKIKSLGGLSKVLPTEGVIFSYKQTTYKLTGIFSPLNKLLNLVRFF